MSEYSFKSAGVFTKEIDASQPSRTTPTGIPAGIISVANKGPAFVPTTFANYNEFKAIFGSSDGSKNGHLAMRQWLKNAGSAVFVRVLGAGDCKKKNANGTVTNAGFVVGSELVQSDGTIGSNPYATIDGPPGRTHFLGCFMSESVGSTYFSEAGTQTTSAAIPVLRGVVMVPSGVNAKLLDGSTYGISGSVDITGGKQYFTLKLDGHISTSKYPNEYLLSFDPNSPVYFANILNANPTELEAAGHYLYTNWDVYPQYASPKNPAVGSIAFLTTGSSTRNDYDSTNFESFESRFDHPKSPWVISQKFGGEIYDLFKIHALDDGESLASKVKISIKNISPSKSPVSEYGTFDLVVRRISDTDSAPVPLEIFSNLSLDPDSENYIERIIGDSRTYYDFDREEGSQKLTVDGNYPNRSAYIRVEMHANVEGKEVPPTSLPFGFRGYSYLNVGAGKVVGSNLTSLLQPPVPIRKNITLGTNNSKVVYTPLHWGVQFEANDNLAEPNKNLQSDNNVFSLLKYFPEHCEFLTDSNSDSKNNNLFTLENIEIVEGDDLKPDPNEWETAVYRRDGTLSGTVGTRFLKSTDLSDIRVSKYLKFSFSLQGGFGGVNIFDKEKAVLSNTAAIREMVDTAQKGPADTTVAAYRKAVDVISEKSDVDVQVVAIPGIREPGVTDYTLDAIENRYDAIYLMDIPEYNVENTVITSSVEVPSVLNTTSKFSSRNLDSSFGAAYYPDVVMVDPDTNVEVMAPASVAALGAFSLNDRMAHPWFAPAGYTRGALTDVSEVKVRLNRDNMDTLYTSNINPIAATPGQLSPTIQGQKTLLNRASSLDRVNVRRLMIELRRRVRNVANQIVFEPNRESTLAKFSSMVNPILSQIQAQAGVERYLVKIDTSTTTQADVENNTIRGKIFVQPTKSTEFISLSFVATNAGAII